MDGSKIATLSRNSGKKSSFLENSKEGIVSLASGAVYPPLNEEIAKILDDCLEYNWKIFQITADSNNHALFLLANHLFTITDLFQTFSLPKDKFANFILEIEQGYHYDLPYHNSTHAADVLHCVSYLSAREKIEPFATDMDYFALYIAAIIHDHDHPGLSNNFLVNTHDNKAILYNDRSVLENHHLASSFKILDKPENNFVSHLSKADYKAFRESVIEFVLATDLTQHFTLLSMYKTKMTSVGTFDPVENREDRTLLYKIIMKCSDVSNPSKKLEIYDPWCGMILEEFYRQGDQERNLGLPISPYCDRGNVNVPSCQIGFIDYVVSPLFEAFNSFQPIPTLLTQLSQNREYW